MKEISNKRNEMIVFVYMMCLIFIVVFEGCVYIVLGVINLLFIGIDIS